MNATLTSMLIFSLILGGLILLAKIVIETQEQRRFNKQTANFKSKGISPATFFEIRKERMKEKLGDVSGVYIIYNVTKDMYYVGQATRLYFRLNQHFTGHGNGDVYADYKYGHKFLISYISLNKSGFNSLDALERTTIEKYNAYNKGYNKTHGNWC